MNGYRNQTESKGEKTIITAFDNYRLRLEKLRQEYSSVPEWAKNENREMAFPLKDLWKALEDVPEAAMTEMFYETDVVGKPGSTVC